MKFALIALVFVLSACPKPLPAPDGPRCPCSAPDQGQAQIQDAGVVVEIPACLTQVELLTEHVCDKMFTVDDVPCANCPGAEACLDMVDQVYCVKGGCAKDSKCKLVNNFPAKKKKPKK